MRRLSKTHLGGTAGCVLASRLSEDPNVSVLLLERGKANDHWISRIPVLAQNPLPGTGFTWFPIEPLEYANKRQDIAALRAEVLGGNTRINGTVYQRGSVADYDHWAALGHPDWSYGKIEPFFVKSERNLHQPKSSYRGTKGASKVWSDIFMRSASDFDHFRALENSEVQTRELTIEMV